MVVKHFDVYRALGPLGPFKANSPLVVHADAELTFAITLQCLEPIARKIEIAHRRRRLQLIELRAQPPRNALKGFDPLSFGEAARALVAVVPIIRNES